MWYPSQLLPRDPLTLIRLARGSPGRNFPRSRFRWQQPTATYKPRKAREDDKPLGRWRPDHGALMNDDYELTSDEFTSDDGDQEFAVDIGDGQSVVEQATTPTREPTPDHQQ